MGKREEFVAKALEYHGYNEADGSHRIVVDLYNAIKPLPVGYRLSYSDPWCAAYVSVISKLCGLLDKVFPECSCERMIELYKKAGRWQGREYTPGVGDIVFYDWDKSGTADHVGIIVSVSGLTLKVIEGNIANSVGYRNLVVGNKDICGFAAPDFEGSGAVTEKNSVFAEDTKPTTQTCSVELLVLRKGMVNGGVRALQLLLIGAGHGVGPDGADGDFGYNTEQAVKACQKKNGLKDDGVAGQATWSALLKQ